MRDRKKNKLLSGDFWKRILYTACFFFFCVIEQREKSLSWEKDWRAIFQNLTGIPLALLIFSHYGLKDIRKWKRPFLGWTVVWILGMPFLLLWGRNHWPFFNVWIVITLNIVLYGYIILFTVIRVFLEKRLPKLNGRYLTLWIVMMAWMIFSRSTLQWPLYYFIMFLCFYLTDYSQKERDQMYLGMLDGIILGFFVIQGLSFVFRPFDSARYRGMFGNSNWNSLFYLEVLAAVLARIIRAAKDGARKWLKAYYWIGAGTVLSFELLTIGRTGWLTAIVMIGIFLKFLGRTRAAGKWFQSLLLLSVCVLLTFPLCFAAARYLPPVFHHPIWYEGEWSEEKAHSWDPWDSEKYVDIDEYFDAALGRVIKSFRLLREHSPFSLNADAAAPLDETPGEAAEEAEPLPPNKIPVLVRPEQSTDDFLVRSTIYKYYFKHLNLFGHPTEEQGFQLTPYYWIGHAHNIFLQYGTDFGVPVMIPFAVLVFGGAISLWKRSEKSYGSAEAGYCLYLLIPVVFGMFEYSWGVGSLSITMLFMAFGKVICADE